MWAFFRGNNSFNSKRKITNYSQLRDYIQQPVCLNCGYDIRVQLQSKLSACPECGQSCMPPDIANQISNQRSDKVPILADLAPGVPQAWKSPILDVILGLLFGLFFVHVLDRDHVWMLLIGLFVLARPFQNCLIATRAYGFRKGLAYFLLSMVYGAVAIIVVLPIILWLIIMIANIVDASMPGSSGKNTIVPPLTALWPHMMLLCSIVALFLNYWWATKWIIRALREDCRSMIIDELGRKKYELDDLEDWLRGVEKDG